MTRIVEAKVAVWMRDSAGEEYITVCEDFRGEMELNRDVMETYPDAGGFRRFVPSPRTRLHLEGDFDTAKSYQRPVRDEAPALPGPALPEPAP